MSARSSSAVLLLAKATRASSKLSSPAGALAAAAAAAAQAQAQYDVVTTKNGPVRGLVTSGGAVRTFRGVPLARAPVGDLRFASPVPAAPWAPATLDCLDVKPACPGLAVQSLIGVLPGIDISEDCLYLNVYAPSRNRTTARPLPVMLWFYGGAFTLGDAWEGGAYDGTYTVARKDVIIVTTNYRLGSFGFLVTDTTRGNYAVEDQRLAMVWVRDNIAAFGGDPKQVTIYGESAGAMSAGVHMSSPLSQGLFQRVLMQSNAFGLQYKPRDAAITMGNKYSENLGCAAGDLACLRALPWQDLALRGGRYAGEGRDQLLGDLLSWGPTVDGANLLEQPLEAFARGAVSDVPLIIGTNSDEIVLFQDIIDSVVAVAARLTGTNFTIEMRETTYRLLVTTIFKTAAPRVLRQYPPLPNDAPNYDQFIGIVTDYIFECSSRNAAKNFVRFATQPVYTYRFSHAPDFFPRLGNFLKCFKDSVCHALELPFTWHMETLLGIPLARFFTPEEDKLSNAMIDYWTAFASGNMSSPTLPVQWRPYTAASPTLLDFDLTIAQGTWDAAKCDFWDGVGYIY
eukprot:Unigene1220_Nuclearia_a/m.3883 Unigene1220_Nuclearia_a/g.3883  ORF Unigene1220_Nuclearia_a/g.3883 Unigene1220_Nuclearia_a/m.3883 type:complete len:569 (+) Unigene1220_Nuclearia_a:1289-2995(+)